MTRPWLIASLFALALAACDLVDDDAECESTCGYLWPDRPEERQNCVDVVCTFERTHPR